MRPAQVSLSTTRSASHRIAWIAALIAICAALALSYLIGSRMRAQMRDLATAAIAQENAAFCGKFGIGPGTPAYADCVDELRALRARHERRMQAENEALR